MQKKNGNVVFCKNCNKEFYLKKSRIESVKENFCSQKCHYENKFKKMILEKEIEIGRPLKDYLNEKYVKELISFRALGKMLNINQRTLKKWLIYYSIEIRRGSDAVKTQWINNDLRRKWSSENLKKHSKTTTINKFNEIELINRVKDKNISVTHVDKGRDKTWVHYVCNVCKFEHKSTFGNLLRRGCPQCKESHGERKIRVFLESNGIEFQRQYKPKGCKFKKQLSFDFAIFMGKELMFLIEYDGIQHFNQNKFNGGEVEFKNITERDRSKDIYCLKNKLTLLRIPYWDCEKIEKILFVKLNELALVN